MKVEASRFGLPAFKMLGASWATYQVLVGRLGCEPTWTTVPELAEQFASLHPLTLLAATDGNHGRAVAAMARLLGFDARIFVPDDMVAARIAGIESEGAEVEIVDGSYDDAVVHAAAGAGDRRLVISDTAWPGYTEPPRRVDRGLLDDLLRDRRRARAPRASRSRASCSRRPVSVRSRRRPSRTHGDRRSRDRSCRSSPRTPRACSRRASKARPRPCPGRTDSMMVGLNCGNVSPVAWTVLGRGLDWCVAVSDTRAPSTRCTCSPTAALRAARPVPRRSRAR